VEADSRYERLDADQWVPLQLAGRVVRKGQSTVYRWVQRNLVSTIDTGDAVLVRVGDLRQADASIRRGRPRHAMNSTADE
jgi:hypothetical protein